MDSPEKEKRSPSEKSEDRSDWSHDIEERDYYYDDSTGYEVYDPDQEEEEEEKADKKEKTDLSP